MQPAKSKKTKKNTTTWLIVGGFGIVIAAMAYYYMQKQKAKQAFGLWLAQVEKDAKENTDAIRSGSISNLPNPIPDYQTIMSWLDVHFEKEDDAYRKQAEQNGVNYHSTNDVWGEQIGFSMFPYKGNNAEKQKAFVADPRFQETFLRNWKSYWEWQIEANPQKIIADGNYQKILKSI